MRVGDGRDEGSKREERQGGGIGRRGDNEERGEDSTIEERIGEEREENIVLVERVVVLDCSHSHGLCSKNDWRQYCFSY